MTLAVRQPRPIFGSMDFPSLLHRLSGRLLPPPPPVVGVLRLEGVIVSGDRAGALNIARLGEAIDKLFELNRLVAVALVINSPGGSPAQSALIQSRIRQRAAEHKMPVLAFAEDVAASGGYWLALAGDEIWVQDGSLIGSIGVISAGFGFTELIEKLGVERRVYAAGEHKGMLDAFRPERAPDIEMLASLQQDLHETFKAMVRQRRGERLSTTASDIFTGAVFTGRQALERGLVDGIGDVDALMRSRFGEKVKLYNIDLEKRSWPWPFRWRRFGASSRSMASIVGTVLDQIEDRLIWARFKL